jgi:hypothetical protein
MNARMLAACLLLSAATHADTAPTAAAIPTPLPTPTDSTITALEDRLRQVQDLLNSLELQSEQVKSDMDKTKPQPISFADGTIELAESTNLTDFQSLSGQIAHLGFNLNPVSHVTGYLQIEAIGDVAVNRLLPQQEVKMALNNDHFIVKRSEAIFEDDTYLLRAFRMIPRADMYEEGYFYYLFPAADDTNKYFRQSGRGVPNGFEGLIKDGPFKGLDVWAGDELIYGVTDPTTFIRFKRQFGSMDFSLMGKVVQDPTYISGKNSVENYELWLGIPMGDKTKFDLVVVDRPTQVGQTYYSIQQVAPGTGIASSNYGYVSTTTTLTDALGAQIRLKSSILPLFEQEVVNLEYSEPLAGNLMRASGLLSERPQRYLLITEEATYQKPIVGPLNLVSYGNPVYSPFNISGPRPYGAVVTVSQDPISGINNREMTQYKATIEFNPGLGWFYLYRPLIVQGWNVNPDLKTPFSMALSGRMWQYPTGTDLGSFITQTGQRVGEQNNATGLLATNGWASEVNNVDVLTTGSVKWQAEFAAGNSYTGISPVFNSLNARPEVYYVTEDLSLSWKNVVLSGGYGENVWGPDDYYQVFGLAIDQRTRAALTWKFGKSSLSFSYEGWRNKNPAQYQLATNTIQTANGAIIVDAPIDQLMSTFTISF